MIFRIGNINVLPWLETYNIQLEPQYGNDAFTCINGDSVNDYKGDKVSVSFSLRRVPSDTAALISAALGGSSVSCTVSAPTDITTSFSKASYRAEPYDKGQKWHFDVTVQSLGVINSGDSL